MVSCRWACMWVRADEQWDASVMLQALSYRTGSYPGSPYNLAAKATMSTQNGPSRHHPGP